VEKLSSGVPTPRAPVKESRQRSEPTRRIPSVLLVDDNKINLRLLQTFMKKRKYELVNSADDGKMAVDSFMNAANRYDIVFMDISTDVCLS
jgi:CheY-like chemotaxis protein